jgi:hypothetical protein
MVMKAATGLASGFDGEMTNALVIGMTHRKLLEIRKNNSPGLGIGYCLAKIGPDLHRAAEQSEQTVWSPHFRKGCRLLGLGKEPGKREATQDVLLG